MVVALVMLSVLSTAAAIWFYHRSRRNHGVPRGEVLSLLRAPPEFRVGFEAAADQVTKQLRDLLDCVAVGITDGAGTLQSWLGAAHEHYADLTGAVESARTAHRREIVAHENLMCANRGRCAMRFAVIVPVHVEATLEAVLIVVGRTERRRLVAMADQAAGFVATLFELARVEESKLALLQAEINVSRAQISPHFLYNALNTIAELIRGDPDQAKDLLFDLADFTRYSFRTKGSFTTLAEELRNVDRYLTIETAHYAGRIRVRLKIAPEVLSVVVPYLIVQPLVENAVRHGLVPKRGGGTVTITAEDRESEALISVEDDGVGMDADRLFTDLLDAHKDGSHIGLGNVNQRMRSIFGDDYALVVETGLDAGTKVSIRVPKFVPGVCLDLPYALTRS